jgi:hypothetical protein
MAAVTPSYRALAAALLIASMLPLSGCSNGFHAAVDEVQPPNAAGQAHGVLARAIVLVKGEAATAAAIAGTLINTGARTDQLQTISLTDTAPGSPTITLTPNLNLRPGQVISLGVGDTPPITVPDATSLRLGDFINVVLHFRTAGDMPLQVACVGRTGYYADVLPAAPSPTPTTTPSASPSATPQ